MKNMDRDCRKGKYDDMIGMVHHQSATRPHMSLHDRAAQFAPFAPLKGHDGQDADEPKEEPESKREWDEEL